jgi:hypothetical protein
MTRRSKIWLWAAGGIYAFINVGGLAFALAQREGMHAMLHLVLLLIGVAGYVGWRLARRGAPEDQLPQTQRFNEKLQADRSGTLPPKKDQ